MAMLELENLNLRLNGTPILNDLSMELWQGYVHAVVGPNGAGKSTLAFTIMGLQDYQDFDGEMRFEGESLKGMEVDQRARRGITLGWQEPARFEGLTVRQYILTGAAEKTDQSVDAALEKVAMEPARYRDRAVDKTLSGGERKKIELAGILAMKPRLVLLDEPDSGIDVESLVSMKKAVHLLRDDGATVVLITHSAEVLQWAEHAFLMCCGHIVEKGSVEKISGYFENKCIPCDHRNRPDVDEELSGETA
ncbi:MAG: ATP-binding cassette domain-containing protein [Planctomycetota bacterium]